VGVFFKKAFNLSVEKVSDAGLSKLTNFCVEQADNANTAIENKQMCFIL
jgi:hypothetical protein